MILILYCKKCFSHGIHNHWLNAKNSISTSCSFKFSLTMRYQISICLFKLSILLFLEKKSAFEYIYIGLDMELITLRSKIKFLNQIVHVVTSYHVMNFSFTINKTIIVCLILLQDRTPPSKREMCPEVLNKLLLFYLCVHFLMFTQPSKYESE